MPLFLSPRYAELVDSELYGVLVLSIRYHLQQLGEARVLEERTFINGRRDLEYVR